MVRKGLNVIEHAGTKRANGRNGENGENGSNRLKHRGNGQGRAGKARKDEKTDKAAARTDRNGAKRPKQRKSAENMKVRTGEGRQNGPRSLKLVPESLALIEWSHPEILSYARNAKSDECSSFDARNDQCWPKLAHNSGNSHINGAKFIEK